MRRQFGTHWPEVTARNGREAFYADNGRFPDKGRPLHDGTQSAEVGGGGEAMDSVSVNCIDG